MKLHAAEVVKNVIIKMTGKIIYTCLFIPAEWIAAHGLNPSRIALNSAGEKGSLEIREGLCPFAQAFIDKFVNGTEAVGIIVTTLCDQMRRAFDIISVESDVPVFLFNIPKTWQNPSSHKLYLDELKRLGRFLTGLGGTTPSNEKLAEVMLEYDSTRKNILDAKDYLSARQFSEIVTQFSRSGTCSVPKQNNRKILISGIPLAIVGGPLMKNDFEIFDIIETAGGRIVLDAAETGERSFCARFDRRALLDNPLIELAHAYFGHIPDAAQRPNNRLYQWLKTELAGRKVRGIILCRFLWCDNWHAELYQLKQTFNLPVLDIDMNGRGQNLPAQTVSRIRAFMEMFR